MKLLQSKHLGRTEVTAGMGAQQSKDQFLYQQVNCGNVEAIKALHRDGAGIEWIDAEGKTPLMLACSRPDLINVVEVLIELGADVNAYRPGSHAGTALHHAAKQGLSRTVYLLLYSGANPFVINDDYCSPLDLARSKGHCNVVRVIEGSKSLFCGWMREFHGPNIIKAFAPKWVQRKIWAVVMPCDYCNPAMPQKFELAIYPDLQAARPREVIQLWKADIEMQDFCRPDPAVIIVDKVAKTRYKLLSGEEVNKHQQLLRFFQACHGQFRENISTPATLEQLAIPEDIQLSMAIEASIWSARAEGISVPVPDGPGLSSGPSMPNGAAQASQPSSSSTQLVSTQHEPSAPPNLIDKESRSGSCVICSDAPVEGACIPCGHMAGCMSCLNDIKRKSRGCPICRADIDQVVRLYAV